MDARDIKEIDSEQLELIRQMEQYLSCPCQLIRPADEDGDIMETYWEARRRGQQQGFVPVLVRCDDLLLEGMLEQSDPDSDGEEFSSRAVEEYRQSLLSMPVTGSTIAVIPTGGQELLTPGEADEAAMDEGGEIEGFTSYWDERTGRTDYILLAEIPVKEPWQAMAWLPMGGWNNCPAPFAMMMTARRWYEEYGAWPAAVSHDILEFAVEQPVPRERCLELAAEQGIFCPERVLTCGEDASLGRLAGDLMRSNIWFFIWD